MPRSTWASNAIFVLRAAAIVIILVVPAFSDDSWRFFSFQMVVAGYLALSFDLAHSYGKVLSFMQGTFFAVGAYATVYLASDGPWGFAWVFVVAVLGGAVSGALVGVVLMRMGGHSVTIATVILAAVGFLAGNALSAYTGGEDGLQLMTNSVGFASWQLPVGSNLAMYYAAAVPLMALIVLSWLLQKRRVWKVLRAIAQNETRAQQLGFNVQRRRLVMFTIAAAISSVGGAFYVLQMRHVTTHVLNIDLSVNAILWAVVGGLGTAFGPIIGVLTVYPITEMVAAVFVYVQILVGLLLVVVAVFFPGGIIGTLKESANALASVGGKVRTEPDATQRVPGSSIDVGKARFAGVPTRK